MADNYDYLLKLLVIGDSGVGKSSLQVRFTDDVFPDNCITTLVLDFRIRYIQLDNKTLKLQIWDTAGHERFRTIISTYYRGAQGVLLVYDITNRESFANIKAWFDEVDRLDGSNVCRLLIGNKTDLESKRVIEYSQGKELADKLGIPFLETSAKLNTNVEQVFITMASEVKSKVDDGQLTTRGSNSVTLGESDQLKQTICC